MKRFVIGDEEYADEINTSYDQDQEIGDDPQALNTEWSNSEPIDAMTGQDFYTIQTGGKKEGLGEYKSVWEVLGYESIDAEKHFNIHEYDPIMEDGYSYQEQEGYGGYYTCKICKQVIHYDGWSSEVNDLLEEHLQDHKVTEKFKSRKQQQWYHASDQDYLDDEPHESRKVIGESKDEVLSYIKNNVDSSSDEIEQALGYNVGMKIINLKNEGKIEYNGRGWQEFLPIGDKWINPLYGEAIESDDVCGNCGSREPADKLEEDGVVNAQGEIMNDPTHEKGFCNPDSCPHYFADNRHDQFWCDDCRATWRDYLYEESYSVEKLNKDGTGTAVARRGIDPKNKKHGIMKFDYVSGADCKICKAYDGKTWHRTSPNRPVIPRLESVGKSSSRPYTHPNCKCRWIKVFNEVYVSNDMIGEAMDPKLISRARKEYKNNKEFDKMPNIERNMIIINMLMKDLGMEAKSDEMIELIDPLPLASMAQIAFNAIKDPLKAKLGKERLASETTHITELTDDELLEKREYMYGLGQSMGYLTKIEAEMRYRGLGDRDWHKEDKVEFSLYESKANEYDCDSCGGEYSNCPHCGYGMHDYEWERENGICNSCGKNKYDSFEVADEDFEAKWAKNFKSMGPAYLYDKEVCNCGKEFDNEHDLYEHIDDMGNYQGQYNHAYSKTINTHEKEWSEESKATERSSNHNFKGNTAEYFVMYYRPDVGGDDDAHIVGWNELKDFAQTVSGVNIRSVYRNGNELPTTKVDRERLEMEAMESKASESADVDRHYDMIKDYLGDGAHALKCKHCGEHMDSEMPEHMLMEHIMFDHNISESLASEYDMWDESEYKMTDPSVLEDDREDGEEVNWKKLAGDIFSGDIIYTEEEREEIKRMDANEFEFSDPEKDVGIFGKIPEWDSYGHDRVEADKAQRQGLTDKMFLDASVDDEDSTGFPWQEGEEGLWSKCKTCDEIVADTDKHEADTGHDDIEMYAMEGGKGSGRLDHRPWMLGADLGDVCEICMISTEWSGTVCTMCGTDRKSLIVESLEDERVWKKMQKSFKPLNDYGSMTDSELESKFKDVYGGYNSTGYGGDQVMDIQIELKKRGITGLVGQ